MVLSGVHSIEKYGFLTKDLGNDGRRKSSREGREKEKEGEKDKRLNAKITEGEKASLSGAMPPYNPRLCF